MNSLENTFLEGSENKGRSPIGTPFFPGSQSGKSIKDIRSWIKKQKRVKGYAFQVPTGGSRESINLSGTARMLLGFAILKDPTVAAGSEVDNFTFTVNNEIVVDQLNPEFFSPDFCDDEFYFIPRPLSGTDEIFIDFVNSSPVQSITLAVYYI